MQDIACEIAVVGGGLTGLLVTRALLAQGRDVLLIEARDRPGGRTFAARYDEGRDPVDWGAEWVIPPLHPRLMALAAEMNVAIDPEGEGAMIQWIVGDRCINASYETLKLERAGFAAALSRMEKDAHRWRDTGVCGGAEDHDLRTYINAIAEDELDRRLLEALLFPLTGGHPAEIATVMLWNEIRYHGDDVDATLAAETYRFVEGAGAIAGRLAATLDPAAVRYGQSVLSIAATSDGAFVTTAELKVSAQQVLVAVPLAVLPDIEFIPALPLAQSRAAQCANAGRTTKLWARIRADTMPPNIVSTDGPLRLVYAKSAENGTYLASAQALSEDIAVDDEASLRMMFSVAYPDTTILSAAATDWFREPYSRASWNAGRKGEAQHVIPAFSDQSGPIRIIGADVASFWTGWMEGAIISADDVLNSL